MVNTRAKKVANVANDIPPQKLDGPAAGDLLVLSWGGTSGACATAVHNVQAKGKAVTHCHLRYLNPLPKDLGDILSRFEKVLIPELNLGQLRTIIRAKYLVDAVGLNKVQGKPFSVGEVVDKIESLLRGDTSDSQAAPERVDGKDTTVKAILQKAAQGG
jgi:2-oxoglutarate ferredoxin oxidoreductase subunit alpha